MEYILLCIYIIIIFLGAYKRDLETINEAITHSKEHEKQLKDEIVRYSQSKLQQCGPLMVSVPPDASYLLTTQ
jgi:hypothetical protein